MWPKNPFSRSTNESYFQKTIMGWQFDTRVHLRSFRGLGPSRTPGSSSSCVQNQEIPTSSALSGSIFVAWLCHTSITTACLPPHALNCRSHYHLTRTDTAVHNCESCKSLNCGKEIKLWLTAYWSVHTCVPRDFARLQQVCRYPPSLNPCQHFYSQSRESM